MRACINAWWLALALLAIPRQATHTVACAPACKPHAKRPVCHRDDVASAFPSGARYAPVFGARHARRHRGCGPAPPLRQAGAARRGRDAAVAVHAAHAARPAPPHPASRPGRGAGHAALRAAASHWRRALAGRHGAATGLVVARASADTHSDSRPSAPSSCVDSAPPTGHSPWAASCLRTWPRARSRCWKLSLAQPASLPPPCSPSRQPWASRWRRLACLLSAAWRALARRTASARLGRGCTWKAGCMTANGLRAPKTAAACMSTPGAASVSVHKACAGCHAKPCIDTLCIQPTAGPSTRASGVAT